MSRGAQKTFEFDRGAQLALRRQVRLPAPEKFILWILDDHIGHGSSWKLTMTQLQEESGFSRSATYNYVNRLNERGLVWWDDLPDGRRDFRICWPNVAGEIEAQAQSTSPPGGIAVHLVESQSTTWTQSPPRGQPSPPGGLHIMNSAPLSAPLSAPSPSSTPRPEKTDEGAGSTFVVRKEELIRSLQACGVRLFVEATEEALANGMTLDQIEGVVEHYRRHPGRWPPEVLWKRVISAQATRLAPDEGWFGELPAWAAQRRREALARSQQSAPDLQRRDAENGELQQLEASYGTQLDRMTSVEVAGLLPANSPLLGFLRRQGAGSPLLRPHLLKAVAKHSSQDAEEEPP